MTDNWIEEELKAAVEAYVQMHALQAKGIPFVKKHIYSLLAERFGRSVKSFEYRMQNISYVYSTMGRKWVDGLKPAKNVGSKTSALIEKLVVEAENKLLLDVVNFETKVTSVKPEINLFQPEGIKEPEKIYSQITSYSRDPKVKAWVLSQAAGICECCDVKAPFLTAEREPFLEVHHLRQLADGGSDTVTNTVALCPNCHREMHYGINRFTLINSMYEKLQRLIQE